MEFTWDCTGDRHLLKNTTFHVKHKMNLHLLLEEKALAAIAAGKFKDEIVPITYKTRKGEVIFIDTDEHPRKTSSRKIS